MNASKLDRAEMIKEAMLMRDAADRLLDLLLPDGAEAGCSHPDDQIEDLSTLDDDGDLYRCRRCGAESATRVFSTPLSTNPE